MRIESPVLVRSDGGSVWVRDDTAARWWMCANAVRRFWDLPRGTARIVLVSSDVRVPGAQPIKLIRGARRLGATVPDTTQELGIYPALQQHLESVARAFGRRDFWGWIEIVQ